MKPGTRRQRLSRSERRERILAAAAEAFAVRGYEGAALEEIAAAAGITKGVIYDHFASKEELHQSLLELRIGELLGVLAEAIRAAPTSEERMRAGTDAFLEFMERDRFAWRALFREPGGGPKVAQSHKERQRQVTEAVVGWMESELSEIETSESEVVAQVLAALFNGALGGIANWWYENPDVPRETLVEMTMAFAWTGLKQAQQASTRRA